MQTPINLASFSSTCECELALDATERFPVMRIIGPSRDCIQHGYLFSVGLADDLRYND